MTKRLLGDLKAFIRSRIARYFQITDAEPAVEELMLRLKQVRSSGPYTRDEMNRR